MAVGFGRRDLLRLALGGLFSESTLEARPRRTRAFVPPPPVFPGEPRSELDLRMRAYLRRLYARPSYWAAPALAHDERVAVVVEDPLTGERLVDINGRVPMQDASMVKPAVSLAVLHEVRGGRLPLEDVAEWIERSIRKSDNHRTNLLIDAIGEPSDVDALLKAEYGRIFKGLSLVERIPVGWRRVGRRMVHVEGKTYRNKESADDHARFMGALRRRELPYASLLLEHMANTETKRLTSRVPQIPAGTTVYQKSGTTFCCIGVKGVVEAPTASGGTRPYTIVIVLDRPAPLGNGVAYENARCDVARTLSGMAYDYQAVRFGLLRPSPSRR